MGNTVEINGSLDTDVEDFDLMNELQSEVSRKLIFLRWKPSSCTLPWEGF